MRISVNYEDGNVFQHFGRTPAFKIYDIEDGNVAREEVIPADGQGHGALPMQLSEMGVDVVICGGLGRPMLNTLQARGFEVCANVTGNADAAVQAYLNGTLSFNQNAHDCH